MFLVMDESPRMKTVGTRTSQREATPQAFRSRALALQQHADRLNPHPKPRGFVFKARNREAYDAWRRAQDNPRLW